MAESRAAGSNSAKVETAEDAPARARNVTTVRDRNVSPSPVKSRSMAYDSTSTMAARAAASARVRLGMRPIMPVRAETSHGETTRMNPDETQRAAMGPVMTAWAGHHDVSGTAETRRWATMTVMRVTNQNWWLP